MLETVRRWSYAVMPEAIGRRDLRLDLLRGFCVFVMIVDHVGGEPSWLYLLTGGDRFLVSAAEGFVLISGVAVGVVYGQVVARQGVAALLAKAIDRARFLYALTIALTLAFAATSVVLAAPWLATLTPDEPHRFVVGVVTLHRSYPYVDVLLLYTFLVLLAGPLLAVVARGHWAPVLGGSWALWGLWQLWPEQAQFPWSVVDGGFPLPPWQVLFVSGLVLGYHRRAVAAFAARRASAIAALSVGATLLLVALVATGALRGLVGDAVFEAYFGKHDLRPGRLLALAVVASATYALATFAWSPLRRATGWLLLPLGQRALAAYATHLFVVALLASPLLAALRAGPAELAQIGAVLAVWTALPLLSRAQELVRATAAVRAPLFLTPARLRVDREAA